MSAGLAQETLEQYQAFRQNAGVADLGQRTQIELTGADRATFLHNLCTNDIKRLEPGNACEAFFTNVQGKILAHGYVICSDECLTIDTVALQADSLLDHLDRYLIREDVVLTDRSAERNELLLAGPQAEGILTGLFDDDLPDGPMHHVDAQISDCGVSLRRIGFGGGDSLLISCAKTAAAKIIEAIAKAGAMKCGCDAAEIVRVETGTPLFGIDISEKNLPQEINRDPLAISFTKGCYLGQETVARIDALGHVNRYLVALRVHGEVVPDRGSEISAENKTVGEVTSAVYSPKLSSPLVLAYVRREHSEPGARLSTPFGEAEVVGLPV